MDVKMLRQAWEAAGQGQVFRFFDSLDDARQQRLAKQLNGFDPRHLTELASRYVTHKAVVSIPPDIQPVKAFPREPNIDQRQLYADAVRRGQEMLRAGK